MYVSLIGGIIMKKKITICLAVVLTVALAISVLTACSLFGGDNNQTNNNQNETKTLNESECSSELNAAITASIAKGNYSIKVVGIADEGKSIVTNIEHDAETQHVTNRLTQNYMGVTTNLYTETYWFVRDGKYYFSARASENASFSAPEELGSKTEFDLAVDNYLLNSIIGKFTLDSSAEVTYEGTKKGTEVTVVATSTAEVGGVSKELYTSYTIKNGLVVSLFQRLSENDYVKTENNITVRYDIGTVELNAGIHVG